MSQVVDTLVEKLVAMEKEAAIQKGDFSLFGLFAREEGQGQWDLVVAAPWLESNQREGLKYLADKIQTILGPEELLSLSRLVVLNENDPFRKAVKNTIKVWHGRASLENFSTPHLQIDKAILVTNC